MATGATLEEIEQEIKEAISFHLDGLREEGLPVPESTNLFLSKQCSQIVYVSAISKASTEA